MRLERRMKPSVEVSTAPIADIVFLLLIYFMLTSSFIVQSSLEVELPSSSSDKPHKGGHTVTIAADGTYAWDDASNTERDDIPQLIEDALENASDDERTITLRTDKETIMDDVAFVMSEVARHGGKVVILTKKNSE